MLTGMAMQSVAPSRRRRIAKADPLKKTGFQLRQSVVDAVKHAVEDGLAESQNAFVERAILHELQEVRRQRVYAAYEEAAEDPVFMADMDQVTADFESSTGDGL